jgi:hypothetical protein
MKVEAGICAAGARRTPTGAVSAPMPRSSTGATRHEIANSPGTHPAKAKKKGGAIMLWTLAALFVVLWALGLVTSYTMGGFIHILIVLAVVTVLIRVIQGRRIT